MTKLAHKPFKNLLQNQNAVDLGTWYVALGMLGLLFCSNNDPRLTLTYLMSVSNLLPNAFKWERIWKVDFYAPKGTSRGLKRALGDM